MTITLADYRALEAAGKITRPLTDTVIGTDSTRRNLDAAHSRIITESPGVVERARPDPSIDGVVVSRLAQGRSRRPEGTPVPPLRDLAPCGTNAAYARHAREAARTGGTIKCEACKDAHRDYQRRRKAAQRDYQRRRKAGFTLIEGGAA
jgi:hypothetical protein